MGKRILDFADGFSSASNPTAVDIGLVYDAVIAPASNSLSTHETWDAYLADAPVAGDRIAVIGNHSLATTVVLSLDDLQVFHWPGVEYSGAAGIAFQVTGDRLKWNGGRFSSFTTAMQLDNPAQFSMLRDMWFNGCTNNVLDNGILTSEVGNINETP